MVLNDGEREDELDLVDETSDLPPHCHLCGDSLLPDQEKIPFQVVPGTVVEIHFWCYQNKEIYSLADENKEEVDEYNNRKSRYWRPNKATQLRESKTSDPTLPKEVKIRGTRQPRVAGSTRTRHYKGESAEGAAVGTTLTRRPGGLQRYIYPETVITRSQQRAYRRQMESEGRLEEIRIPGIPPRPDFGSTKKILIISENGIKSKRITVPLPDEPEKRRRRKIMKVQDPVPFAQPNNWEKLQNEVNNLVFEQPPISFEEPTIKLTPITTLKSIINKFFRKG